VSYIEFKVTGFSSECSNKNVVKNKVLSLHKIIKEGEEVIKCLNGHEKRAETIVDY
jgi:hypothetical protein